ncbi:MAG: amidohydrolase family protein, partial [Anaerolineales bacterium]|nr:amidohydrolase family protein [Anaerolineales bacterium]MDW8447166.1 amidohydrolase family protein [Anaerolineales bacterium]
DHQKITHDVSFTEKVYKAAQQSGLRVWIARAWSDRGSGAENPKVVMEELERWLSNNKVNQRVKFANGPLAPWRCSAETLQATHQLALQYGAFTHIHVSETQEEVKLTWDEYRKHPVEWLESLGILGEHIQIVHGVWVQEPELQLLAERKALVVHCPVSNAVLGSGIAPLGDFIERGIRVRLGTDGPASNDVQDCFETMKFALCLARAANCKPSLIPPRLALEVAWGKPGLRRGEAADLAILRLDTVWTAPVHDLDSALVLSARASNVESLLIEGDWVLRDGKILTIDEETLIKEGSALLKWLRQKAGLED